LRGPKTREIAGVEGARFQMEEKKVETPSPLNP
jgi:hypothetical protein